MSLDEARRRAAEIPNSWVSDEIVDRERRRREEYNRNYMRYPSPSRIDDIIDVFHCPDFHIDGSGCPIRMPIYDNQIRINEGSPVGNVNIRSIELHPHRFSLHITREALHDWSRNPHNYVPIRAGGSRCDLFARWVNDFFRLISNNAYEVIRQESFDGIHNTILGKVEVVFQSRTDRVLIDVLIYSTSRQTAQYYLDMFHNILTRYASGQPLREERVDPIIRNEHFMNWRMLDASLLGHTYDKKAEERANKLLETLLNNPGKSKGLLSITKLTRYKNRGEVIIKKSNKKGITQYTVKKGSMIDVKETLKPKGTHTYRICVEPKKHGTICPTDEVVAKIRLILADEKKLHKIGNRFGE